MSIRDPSAALRMTKRGIVGRGLAPAVMVEIVVLADKRDYAYGVAIFTCGKRYYAYGIAICFPMENVFNSHDIKSTLARCKSAFLF